MKTINRMLAMATVATVLGICSAAQAQLTAVGDDGIAASPKLRAQLNERKARTSVAAETNPAAGVTRSGTKPAAAVSIAASPKLAQMLAERETSRNSSAAITSTVSTIARADDGIAASPKLREQLNERRQRFELAPVK